MKKSLLILVLITLNIYAQRDTLIFQADYIPHPDTVLIVTPDDYSDQQTYPLVYLLHGWTGYWSYWDEISNLDSLANEFGFIIVCPDGFNDSWYVDSPLKPNVQYEKHFWNDVAPAIEKKYQYPKDEVFITGLSMGGHGAITIFLKKKDYFRAAGSMSGILDLTHFPDRWSIRDGIGSIKDYPDAWENNSAINLIGNIIDTEKEVIVECGTEDFAYEVNKKFMKACLDQKVKCTFISRPGKHNRDFWREAVGRHLRFFNKLVNAHN
ncbi:MAG: hypothetical protein SCALA702_06120 [Melioribacteraceae bacterium]|nr:MAG: hypothetical protein SCALA702_06120 [Melioribacteraceae bacterium]